jgi:hypothetical protein
VATLVGPVLLRVRSGALPPPLEPWTRTWTEAFVVKFWADLVPDTDAVLFSVVPLAAVTWPRIVTVTVTPPATVPIWQVTTLPFGPPWVQVPCVLVIVSWGRPGGLWIVPTPLTWSVITTVSTFAPPVFVIVIV